MLTCPKVILILQAWRQCHKLTHYGNGYWHVLSISSMNFPCSLISYCPNGKNTSTMNLCHCVQHCTNFHSGASGKLQPKRWAPIWAHWAARLKHGNCFRISLAQIQNWLGNYIKSVWFLLPENTTMMCYDIYAIGYQYILKYVEMWFSDVCANPT